MKKTINVTARDIQKGERKDCELCPIARAAGRVMGRVNVLPHSIYYGAFDRVTALPSEAQEFIKKFDTYGARNVAPFKFKIETN